MKHFFKKNKFRIWGAGGMSAPTPEPPNVVQYPSVLGPPQLGDLNTISSFAYAEMIDLISDGPIDGLINKNGKKIYEDNIFEGIYLNDVAIKETSSIKTQKISIDFLKRALKNYWSQNKWLYPFINKPTSTGIVTSASKQIYSEKHGLLVGDVIYIESFGQAETNKNNANYYEISQVIDENIFSIIRYNINNLSLIDFSSTQSSAWNSFNGLTIEFKYTEQTGVQILKTGSSTISIDNANFDAGIKIQSFHPSDSSYNFIKKIGGSFDILPLLEKTLKKSPIQDEDVFLTVVEIPKFKIFISKDRFDPTEGGVNGQYPLKIMIPNLANYIYFSISSDSLNSFNYFEIPRSYVENSTLTASNKKTFTKTIIPNDSYLEYDVFNLKIFIWSIYSEIEGIKNIDNVLEKYFNNLIVYQNDPSLYNYNLVQTEFKNGSEIQSPFKNINNIEIETDYAKELVGPFKLTNCLITPAQKDLEAVYQSVQKLTQLQATSTSKPSYLRENAESSDDIRYVKVWPIEYCCNGQPYLLCNGYFNYSCFDKTSASKISQDAVPITHYVNNNNVEEVYVTIGINSLFDTAHVDLITANATNMPGVNKPQQTRPVPLGVGTYADLGGGDYLSNTLKSGYLLVAGNSINDGKIIFFSEDIKNIYSGIATTIDPNFGYYSYIKSSIGLSSKINNIDSFVSSGIFLNSKGKYDLSASSPLLNWFIPSNFCYTQESICINSYIGNPNAFETKLKSKNTDGSFVYPFGLTERESLRSNNNNYLVDCTTSPLVATSAKTALSAIGITNLKIAEFKYYTASSTELRSRAVVAVKINSYINWSKIFKNWDSINNRLPIPANLSSSFYLEVFDEIISIYPNIKKYLVDQFLRLGSIEKSKNPSLNFYSASILPNLYLVGFNDHFLQSQTSYFDSNNQFLNSILDQLLEDYVLKSQNSFIKVNELGKTSSLDLSYELEQILLKFEGGKLIGSSRIYDFEPIVNINNIEYYPQLGSIPVDKVQVFLNSSKTFYDYKTIYFYNEAYAKTNSVNDAVIFYRLFTNIVSNQNNANLPAPTFHKYINDTTVSANDTKIGLVKQSINAGSRLPTIVRLQVETGYESKEKINYIGRDEYNKYIFEIFGMTSADQSAIDLGRSSYDFVYAERGNFSLGGFLSKTVNLYFEDREFYLFKVIFKRKKTTDASSLTNTYYFLINKRTFNLGDLNFDKKQKEETSKNLTYIKDNQDNIQGLKQISNVSISDSLIDSIINNLTLSSSSNNFGLFQLTSDEIGIYFNNNFEELDLGRAAAFFKKIFTTSATNKSLETILSSDINTLESYADAYSSYSGNLDKFDTYQIYWDSNNQIDINIYNYKANSYKIVDVQSSDFTPLTFASSYYFYFYFEESIGRDYLYKNLLDSFPEDVIIKFNSLEENASYQEINSNTYFWNIGNFIIHISKTKRTAASSSYINPVNLPLFKENDKFFGAAKTSLDLNAFRINLLNHIDAYLKEELILDKIKAKKLANGTNFLTDALDANGENMTFNFEELRNQVLNKNWVIEHQFSQIPINFADNFLLINNSTLSSNNKSIYHINSSEEFVLNPIDVRSRASGIKNATEPIFHNISFWTIKNPNTNKIHVIFKQPISSTDLSNMTKETVEAINIYDWGIVQKGPFTANSKSIKVNGSGNGSDPAYDGETSGPTIIYWPINNLTSIRGTGDYWIGPQASRIAPLKYFFSNYNYTSYIYDMFGDEYRVVMNHNRYWYSTNALFFELNITGGISTKGNEIIKSNWKQFLPEGWQRFEPGWFKHWDWFTKNVIFETPKIREDGFHNTIKNPLTEKSEQLRIISFDDTNINDNSSLLRNVEIELQKRGIIRRDIRFRNLEYVPEIYNLKTSTEPIIFSYFEEMPVSNIDADTNKTFANDAGTSIKLPVPKYYSDGTPFRRYVKVTKLSYETLSPLVSKKITLNKITEIIPQKFLYPFSAMVATKIDSRAFSQVPTRTFDCKLKKILIPSNYFPENEDGEDVRYLEGNGVYKIYDGDWDGTFKLAWTNNPAWILMDMLVNKRYGLGNYIQSEQIDIWELYKIARWCDAVDDNGYYYGVTDAYGGVEPRHAFNGLISEKFNVFDMINQIASIFRGSVYYMNSLITFDDDRLKPAIGEFTNLDVKDGIFNYANNKKDDEFTVVEVAYIDEKNNYKPSIEYVEDSDGIRKRGILKKQINAFGITSKGQARRFGLHFLFQTSKENTNVSFTTDIKALLYKPGDLIEINDELNSSYKNFGKIEKIENFDNFFKIIGSPQINDDLLSAEEINIYTPTAKPKYEDLESSIENLPLSLKLTTNKSIFKRSNGEYLSLQAELCKSQDMDLRNKSYYYTGNVQYVDVANKKQNIYFTYISEYDINNNYYSKYGHWRLTTGLPDNSFQDFYLLDSTNSIEKNTNSNQQYFFNSIDTGIFLCYTGTGIFGEALYCQSGFALDGSVNQPLSLSINTTKGFYSGVINYYEIIENDRPSIETFKITGRNNIDNYTEFYISKSGWDKNNNFFKIKESVINGIQNLVTGSLFSINILNSNKCLFKIASITENYINEYNIFASQYNPDKFKLIEENSSVDDLNSTFNFISAYNSRNYNDVVNKDNIIFNNLKIIKSLNNEFYLDITWSITEATQYDIYKIYVSTPASFGKQIIFSNKKDENYDEIKKEYNLKINLNNFQNQIGTYEVTLLGDGSSSKQVKRTVSFFNY